MGEDSLEDFEDDRERDIDRIAKGPMLEELTSTLFELAGFNTTVRDESTEYEIDVLAEDQDTEIIIECKNRGNESISVKNLIHEWSGKKEELGIKNALLVLNGAKVKQSDRDLARKNKIRIWNTSQLQRMLKTVKEQREDAKVKILEDLRINLEEVRKLRAERREKWEPPYELIWRAYVKYGGKRWNYIAIGINEDSEEKFWEILNVDQEYSDHFKFQNAFSRDQEKFYPAKTVLLPMWKLDNKHDEKIIKYADENNYYCIIFRDIEIDIDLEKYDIEVKEIEEVADQINTQLEHWK
ncbi:MAG: restriction endonuclease [Candidatus Nanohalobium sp.]